MEGIDDAQGMSGAAGMMHRLQNMFTWQCANDAVDDGVIDQLVQAYVLDPPVQEFMQKENLCYGKKLPGFWSCIHGGKWKAEENCLKELQSQYSEAGSGDLEDQIADAGGEMAGGEY